MDNYINMFDKICAEFVYLISEGNKKINKSVKRSPEDAFIEQMADFLGLITAKTGIRMANQLILLLQHHNFNVSPFRDKFRNLS